MVNFILFFFIWATQISWFCNILRFEIWDFWPSQSLKRLGWSKISNLKTFSLKVFDFAKFHHSQDRSNQKSQIWAKFSTRFKYLDIAKFHHSQDRGDQKSQIWATFSTRLKYLDIAKFHRLLNQGHQKSIIWAKFSMWLKFLDFEIFYCFRTGMVKNLKFWVFCFKNLF